MVALARENRISKSRLTYYKEFGVERMKSVHPQLLLLHDWPVAPPHIRHVYARRPEAEIAEAARPAFVCCGHHHTAADFNSARHTFSPSTLFPRKNLSTGTAYVPAGAPFSNGMAVLSSSFNRGQALDERSQRPQITQ